MRILRNFIDQLFNRRNRHVMSLTEFEYWTNLKFNHDNFLHEWGEIKVSEGMVRDAWKLGIKINEISLLGNKKGIVKKVETSYMGIKIK